MSSKRHVFDYEPVAPEAWRGERRAGAEADAASGPGPEGAADAPRGGRHAAFVLKRGHAVTYFLLFVFTVFVYIRPYVFLPPLAPLSEVAFPLGLLTLLVFLPTQLALEGNATAPLREVKLILLLCLTALLSMPLAVNPGEAWATFSGVFIKSVVIFVVIVNAVRTRGRLKGLMAITLAAGCILSASALANYLTGNLAVEGYRVKAELGGWMGNPNDTALHLVTMIPLLAAQFVGTRNLPKKALYAAAAAAMAAGMVVTFSRGAFLGLAAALAVLAFKLARRNRVAVVAIVVVTALAFLVFSPSNYSNRVLSIFDHSLDPFGSAGMRQNVLLRSLLVALYNPVFGVGMGNFHILSIRELVTHNAYTEVAAEMGLAALVIYVLFIVSPLRRLRRIEQETFAGRAGSHFYYASVGLQASIVAYMVGSFFASVAYLWYVYYLVGFAVCLRRLYEAEVGREVVGTSLAAERKKAARAAGRGAGAAPPELAGASQ